MASKRAQIAKLTRDLSESRRHEDDALRASRLLKQRLTAECAKHYPVIDQGQDALRLGNRAGGLRITCAECPHFWPCPSWRALRWIYNGDEATYSLRMERIEATR